MPISSTTLPLRAFARYIVKCTVWCVHESFIKQRETNMERMWRRALERWQQPAVALTAMTREESDSKTMERRREKMEIKKKKKIVTNGR